jgi:UDPglucose 6-dehydrogenase
MRVCIVGTGYVGLVTGVGLASLGHQVVCVDLDGAKVAQINSGESPIHEAGLDQLLAAVARIELFATTDLARAVSNAELTMICVGTPFDRDRIDLTQVRSAARAIGEALRSTTAYHTVVVKSTVVPGTTQEVVVPLLEQGSGRTAGDGFGVGMNPEFLREGVAVDDFMHPDRIVLGGIDARTIDSMVRLYEPLLDRCHRVGNGDVEILRTTLDTAEMIKYTSNSLLATLISFSNEIANLAASVGVDAVDVMEGLHLDRRLTTQLADGSRVRPGILTYLEGGCGFGGSCFGKDVRALIALGHERGHPMTMLQSTIEINQAQPLKMVELLERRLSPLIGRRVAVLGLAFKPGTDDVRDSPSLPVVERLVELGAQVLAYDPIAHDAARPMLSDRVRFASSLAEALDDAEAILIMTRWDEFASVPQLICNRDPQPWVVDGRRMLSRHQVAQYEAIGFSEMRPR